MYCRRLKYNISELNIGVPLHSMKILYDIMNIPKIKNLKIIKLFLLFTFWDSFAVITDNFYHQKQQCTTVIH